MKNDFSLKTDVQQQSLPGRSLIGKNFEIDTFNKREWVI